MLYFIINQILSYTGKNIVIDCGPDFRRQMLDSSCDRVDAIFFTHEHNDHVAGLDDIRPFYYKQGNINLYAHERVLNSLKKRFDYIFETKDKYPGAPSVNHHIINENAVFEIGLKKLTPKPNQKPQNTLWPDFFFEVVFYQP